MHGDDVASRLGGVGLVGHLDAVGCAPHAITGSATLNARFPGRSCLPASGRTVPAAGCAVGIRRPKNKEAGLHYNWHRSYDPSIGRYTQPDPLGFVDGPSVYGYAKGSPHRYVDRTGRNTLVINPTTIGLCIANPVACGLIVTACVLSAPPVQTKIRNWVESRENDLPAKGPPRRSHAARPS